jgi:hypothetical protein
MYHFAILRIGLHCHIAKQFAEQANPALTYRHIKISTLPSYAIPRVEQGRGHCP